MTQSPSPETEVRLLLRKQLSLAEERLDRAITALEALTMWSMNGEQLCFRTAQSIPMAMSKKQERLAREALDVE